MAAWFEPLGNRVGTFSGLLTGSFLALLTIPYIFFQLVALNGVSENQGLWAMGLWLLFHLLISVLSTWAAVRMSRFFFLQWKWSKVGSLALAVFTGIIGGAATSFLAVIAAILFAGIR